MAIAPLRPGLLEGRDIALSPATDSVLARTLSELSASVRSTQDDGVPQALIVDHSQGQPDGVMVLGRELWPPLLEVAGRMISAAQPGKVVLLAPRPGTSEDGPALRAALENLARTLSVEWARYRLTVTAVLPGSATGDAEVAALVAFLVSEAGGYFTGCRFELGATRTDRP